MNRGSVVVEGVLTLFLITLACVLNTELVRRAHYEVLLHHGAFLLVRGRALGKSNARVRAEVRDLLQKALGAERGKNLSRLLDVEESAVGKGMEVKVHYRYPSFLRFRYGRGTKHHFEITKPCKFPFS